MQGCTTPFEFCYILVGTVSFTPSFQFMLIVIWSLGGRPLWVEPVGGGAVGPSLQPKSVQIPVQVPVPATLCHEDLMSVDMNRLGGMVVALASAAGGAERILKLQANVRIRSPGAAAAAPPSSSMSHPSAVVATSSSSVASCRRPVELFAVRGSLCIVGLLCPVAIPAISPAATDRFARTNVVSPLHAPLLPMLLLLLSLLEPPLTLDADMGTVSSVVATVQQPQAGVKGNTAPIAAQQQRATNPLEAARYSSLQQTTPTSSTTMIVVETPNAPSKKLSAAVAAESPSPPLVVVAEQVRITEPVPPPAAAARWHIVTQALLVQRQVDAADRAAKERFTGKDVLRDASRQMWQVHRLLRYRAELMRHNNSRLPCRDPQHQPSLALALSDLLSNALQAPVSEFVAWWCRYRDLLLARLVVLRRTLSTAHAAPSDDPPRLEDHFYGPLSTGMQGRRLAVRFHRLCDASSLSDHLHDALCLDVDRSKGSSSTARRDENRSAESEVQPCAVPLLLTPSAMEMLDGVAPMMAFHNVDDAAHSGTGSGTCVVFVSPAAFRPGVPAAFVPASATSSGPLVRSGPLLQQDEALDAMLISWNKMVDSSVRVA